MVTGKVVVITGASGGIGAALARQLAESGNRVVLAARREAELQAVAAPYGDNARAVVADVRHRADVERIRDEALAAFGHVDVWVNNAGRGISKHVLDLTEHDFHEIMDVNVLSAILGMQAIVPHFQERGEGHLINVSSFLGRVPLATFRSAYNAAKAALNALTANLRMDLARDYPNIHVTLVMPGPVSTEFAVNSLGARPPAAPGLPLDRTPGGPPPQTADEAAAAIVAVIAQPAPEIFTNPAQEPVAWAYVQDIAAFEARLRGA